MNSDFLELLKRTEKFSHSSRKKSDLFVPDISESVFVASAERESFPKLISKYRQFVKAVRLDKRIKSLEPEMGKKMSVEASLPKPKLLSVQEEDSSKLSVPSEPKHTEEPAVKTPASQNQPLPQSPDSGDVSLRPDSVGGAFTEQSSDLKHHSPEPESAEVLPKEPEFPEKTPDYVEQKEEISEDLLEDYESLKSGLDSLLSELVTSDGQSAEDLKNRILELTKSLIHSKSNIEKKRIREEIVSIKAKLDSLSGKRGESDVLKKVLSYLESKLVRSANVISDLPFDKQITLFSEFSENLLKAASESLSKLGSSEKKEVVASLSSRISSIKEALSRLSSLKKASQSIKSKSSIGENDVKIAELSEYSDSYLLTYLRVKDKKSFEKYLDKKLTRAEAVWLGLQMLAKEKGADISWVVE